MENLYTDEQYAEKAIEANETGKTLYVYTSTKNDKEYAKLVINEKDYYICYRDNYTDGTVNPEYKSVIFNRKRDEKLQQLQKELAEKYSSPDATFTFNLPATLKGGTIETVDVPSFTLSSYTTYGGIREALRDMKEVPEVLLSDILITSDGLTILGLNDIIDLAGTPVRRIYAIWLTMVEISARVTLYSRELEDRIYAAQTVEELDDIVIDFSQF